MSDSSKQVTVTEDGVEVQRTIEDRSTATVVVYRLRTVASTPAVAHVAESIPPQDRVETLEFHPKHPPNDWTKGDGTVQFDVIVPSNRTRTVVLGLEAAGEEPLGRDGPTVSRSELSMDDLRDADSTGSVTSGFDADAPEAGGSNLLDHDIEPVADGGDTSADAASDEVLDLPDPNGDDDETDDAETGDDASGGDETDDEVLDLPDPNADDDETDDDGSGDGVLDPPDPSEGTTVDAVGEDDGPDGEASAGPDANDSDDPAVEESATPGAEPSPDIDDEAPGGEHGDDDPAEPIVSDDADGDGLTLDGDAVDDLRLDDGTADDRTLDDAGSAGSTDDDSLLGDLLAEIQSGDASEAELDALRSELGVARADEVRVQHVQSRMSDFEAYVDALEGIINAHGTASEFVDSIERSVTDLESELGSVREVVDTVEDGLEAADEDREQLRGEVADLDETVGELSDEMAELRAEMEALRDERAAGFDRIETEIDSLREDVESFNELRRTLLDAFGNGLDVTPADDDTER